MNNKTADAENEKDHSDRRHHHQQDHQRPARHSLRCSVVVVSDTRDEKSDRSGRLLCDLLAAEGYQPQPRQFVVDEIDDIQALVRRLAPLAAERTAEADEAVDLLLLTGGTGVAPRDCTPEALAPLLQRQLPGFAETFRRLSFDEVGVHGLFSRALAGVRGRTAIFALPGSKNACNTAMEKLVLPMLPHLLGLIGAGPG